MLNSIYLGDVFISDSLQDTNFTVTIPETLTASNNVITITNNDFYLPSIISVTVTKEEKTIDEYTFENVDNVITITISSMKIFAMQSHQFTLMTI